MHKGLIPLNVGVTGHRDVVAEDRDAIEIHVRSFFNELRRDYPSTPLRVYSGLAVGTDQFVAEIALAAKVGYHAIEPWTNELDAYVQAKGTLKDLGQRIKDA